MTQLNGFFGPVTVVDANHFTLTGVDSTGFTVYTSGGTASWGQSVDSGSSTVIATGDIRVVDQVTAPDGLPIGLSPNGSISIAAGTALGRQQFNCDVYSVSAGALIGSAAEYFQDRAPVPPPSDQRFNPAAIVLPASQSITPVLVNTLASDPQGDVLSVSFAGLPAGLSLSGAQLVGTTGNAAIIPITGTWSNDSGDSASSVVNLVIGQVVTPSVVGQAQVNIQGLLNPYYLAATFGTQDDPNPNGPAAAGIAITQNPLPGVPVAPNTIISVTLSTGVAPLTQVAVPNAQLGPIDVATATALFTNAGFQVSIGQPWVGSQLIAQRPTPGELLPSGTVVYLGVLAARPSPPRHKKIVKARPRPPQLTQIRVRAQKKKR
jgi:hypothetical protein